MARKRFPSLFLLCCLLGGLLAGALPARADELQRIQELRECIDRTDPTRGQDPAWRDQNCPDTIEQAEAELARVLNEQAVERTAAEAKRKKEQAEEKASQAAPQVEADSGGNSETTSRTSRKTAASSPAPSVPALPAPSLRTAPSDPSLQAPPVSPEPCVTPTDIFDFTASAAGQIFGFGPPLPALGTVGQTQTSLYTLGSELTGTLCQDALRVNSAANVPTFEAQLQPVLLDIEKEALDFISLTPITFVGPGEEFTYSITVTNNSTAIASGHVDDTLPSQVVFDGFFLDELGCTESAGDINCDFTGLPIGESFTTYIDVHVVDDYCDDPAEIPLVANQATVTEPAGTTPTDTDIATVTVICVPLNVEKAALAPGGEMLEGGDSFSYLITITNEGPETIPGTLDDELPVPPLLITGDPTTSGPIECVLEEGILDCKYELDEDETATVIVPVRIPEDYCDPHGLQNTVQAYVTVQDQQVLADRDTIFTEIACADVGIEKTSDANSYFTGEIVTYTLKVTNFGPATARDVEVFDEHPTGLQFLSATTTQGSCANQGASVLCQLGDMNPESTVTIILKYLITNQAPCDDGTTDNVAEVRAANEGGSKEPGPILIDGSSGGAPTLELATIGGGGKHGEPNVDEVSVNVSCAPNIVVSKTASNVDVGGTITYTISATNIGTAEAQNAVVTDDLDNNLTNVSAAASQGSCVVGAGNSVGCSLGTIPINGTATVTIKATVPASACSSIKNAASGAASNEAAGARTDNTASVTTQIGGCVLGLKAGRAEVVEILAVTGIEATPLLILALLFMLSGAGILYAARD